MSRYSPYITKPPTQWQQQINDLNSTRLFLVSTLGPTVFILKGDDMTESTFKVFIGERQMCSCGGGEGRGQLCTHLLFVMIKVLRVPEDNPMAWQLSLVDSEIDAILSGDIHSRMLAKKNDRNNRNSNTNARNKSTYKYLKKGEGVMMMKKRQERPIGSDCYNEKTDKEKGERANNELEIVLPRKPLEEDNVCSICQEEFTIYDFENDILCFCENQCGTNFHKKCFRMYAAYNRSEKKVISWYVLVETSSRLCPCCCFSCCFNLCV